MTTQSYDDGYYAGYNGLPFSPTKDCLYQHYCDGWHDGDDDRTAIESASKFDQPLELPEDYRF